MLLRLRPEGSETWSSMQPMPSSWSVSGTILRTCRARVLVCACVRACVRACLCVRACMLVRASCVRVRVRAIACVR
jgi:hypothetical protein